MFFVYVGRLNNILVLFLLQHLNWIERYSTMKIGRFFFVWVYISYACAERVLKILETKVIYILSNLVLSLFENL